MIQVYTTCGLYQVRTCCGCAAVVAELALVVAITVSVTCARLDVGNAVARRPRGPGGTVGGRGWMEEGHVKEQWTQSHSRSYTCGIFE